MEAADGAQSVDIGWQRNGVTFSLNTYPDIFPDLRHP